MTGPVTTGGVPYPLRAGKRVTSTKAAPVSQAGRKSSGHGRMAKGKGGK
jgi:hypothetical protein